MYLSRVFKSRHISYFICSCGKIDKKSYMRKERFGWAHVQECNPPKCDAAGPASPHPHRHTTETKERSMNLKGNKGGGCMGGYGRRKGKGKR